MQTLNKEETKQYYETHQHPMDQTVHQQHWDGKSFLNHVYLHARKIDQLRSEIDRSYLRLERIKSNLMGHMGLAKDAWVPEEWLPIDPVARRLHGRFFRLLANIRPSRVDKRMRRSAFFKCPPCGHRLDADAHGSETLAYFLLLRPGGHAPGP